MWRINHSICCHLSAHQPSFKFLHRPDWILIHVDICHEVSNCASISVKRQRKISQLQKCLLPFADGGLCQLHLVSCKLQLSCSVSTWECDWPHKTILTSEVPSCQICQGENTACCLILTWRRSQRWVENPKGINSMAKGHCISVSDCLWAPHLGSMTLPREKLFRQEPKATGQHGSKKYSYSVFLTGLILLIFSFAKKMLRMFFGFPTYPLLLEWTLKNQRHLAKQTSLWLLRHGASHQHHNNHLDFALFGDHFYFSWWPIIFLTYKLLTPGSIYWRAQPSKALLSEWFWPTMSITKYNLLTTFYREVSMGQQKINCSWCTVSACYHLLSLHYVPNAIP